MAWDPQPLERLAFSEIERNFSDLLVDRQGGVYAAVLAPVERALLRNALLATRGNQLQTAALLGINRNTLRKKLKLHGLLNVATEDLAPMPAEQLPSA